MEVQQSGIWPPLCEYLIHRVVIERISQVQPPAQVVSSANVIAGKDICPAKTSKQYVFRGPSSDASQLLQTFHGFPVFKMGQLCWIECSAHHFAPRRFRASPLLLLKPICRNALSESLAKSSGLGKAKRMPEAVSKGMPRPLQRHDSADQSYVKTELLAGFHSRHLRTATEIEAVSTRGNAGRVREVAHPSWRTDKRQSDLPALPTIFALHRRS